jgi:serine protease AprX
MIKSTKKGDSMKFLILAIFLVSTNVLAQDSNSRYLVIYKEQNPTQLRSLRSQKLQKYLKQQTALNERALFNSTVSANAARTKNSLWILNSTIVQLSEQELRAVSQSNRVRKIFKLGRRAQIVQSQNGFSALNTKDYTYGLIKILVPEVRTKYVGLDGRGIKVGIIDTGLDDNHPDLKNRMIAFRDFINPANKRPMDDNGHGTHVAGTIAGGSTSGRSIGVAPGAELVIAKGFNSRGNSEDAQLLLALQWMADPDGNSETKDHVDIINNSWNAYGGLNSLTPESDPFCAVLNRLRAMDVIPVFAAGNDGPRADTIFVPGACPDSFTVGATDSRDSVASFSSRGPVKWKNQVVQKPDLSAPGAGVLSAETGGGYSTKSGTSMATPHVAGALAVVMQSLNPAVRLTAENKLKKSVNDLGQAGFDSSYGLGRINLLQALTVE